MCQTAACLHAPHATPPPHTLPLSSPNCLRGAAEPTHRSPPSRAHAPPMTPPTRDSDSHRMAIATAARRSLCAQCTFNCMPLARSVRHASLMHAVHTPPYWLQATTAKSLRSASTRRSTLAPSHCCQSCSATSRVWPLAARAQCLAPGHTGGSDVSRFPCADLMGTPPHQHASRVR